MQTLRLAAAALALVLTLDPDQGWAAFSEVYVFPPDQSSFSIGNYTDSRTDVMADFNGDGLPELYPVDGARLSIVTLTGPAFTSTELWSYLLPETPDFVSVLTANLTPHPGKEVIVDWGTYSDGSHLIVVSASGTLLWDFGLTPFGDLADFNGDGLEEIILGDVGGSFSVWAYDASLASAAPATPPLKFQHSQAVPNPFHATTRLQFDLLGSAAPEISIVDTGGRLVWRRALGHLDPGRHDTKWDGTDMTGQQVAAGVYYYTVRAGSWRSSSKMIRR